MQACGKKHEAGQFCRYRSHDISFGRSLALMLLIFSQQPLALFYIEERRRTTRADCIYAPGYNDLLFYIYMENIDGFLRGRYTQENSEEVGYVKSRQCSPYKYRRADHCTLARKYSRHE